MSELDLTTALRALGSRLEETPDLVPAVIARLENGSASASAPRSRRRSRRLLVVALALLLVVAATAVASSQSVRDWLLHRGVEARPVATLPDAAAGSLSDLGAPVDADAVGEVFGRPLPSSGLLGAPNAVRSDRRAREVTLVWADRPTLPPSPSFPGVGALLTVWPDDAEHHGFVVAKALASGSEAEFLNLPDGTDAVWIAGAPHAVTVFDGWTVKFRLAANVLIWTANGLNHRLETTLTRDRAVELASSFTPGP